jgi:hypothetical protein
MVPVRYHDFFTACASVAGALIGLLFVAISVSPARLTGEQASTTHQVTAATAFSALVNALVIALVGLLPGGDLGTTAIVLAGVGFSSTAGLALLLYRTRQGPIRPGSFVPLLIPLVLYALQLVNGIGIETSPGDPRRITSQAVLSIVFFVFAIARSWQLVGVRDAELIHALAELTRRRSGPDTASDHQGEGDPPGSQDAPG